MNGPSIDFHSLSASKGQSIPLLEGILLDEQDRPVVSSVRRQSAQKFSAALTLGPVLGFLLTFIFFTGLGIVLAVCFVGLILWCARGLISHALSHFRA